jgi:hypothetical protein
MSMPLALVSVPASHDDTEKNGSRKHSATAKNGAQRSVLLILAHPRSLSTMRVAWTLEGVVRVGEIPLGPCAMP